MNKLVRKNYDGLISDMKTFTENEMSSLRLFVESREHNPTDLLTDEELAVLSSNNYKKACW